MKIKIYCDNCKETLMIDCALEKRNDSVWFTGYCTNCGAFWCKKLGTKSQYIEHQYEEWYENYKYNIEDENFKGVISDGKVSDS